MAYGYGDGGGGPTRQMLENIREMGAFPATPRVRNASVREFFENLEAKSGEQLPTWNGELYFELHRGTYTSQSRNKRANRKSEFLLHDAEFLATLASQVDAEYVYPASRSEQGVGTGLPQSVSRHHSRQQHRAGLHRIAGAVCGSRDAG